MTSKWRFALAFASFLAVVTPSRANEPTWMATPSLAPSLEVWTSAGLANGHWSLWSGMTYAPGSLIEPEGWRFRVVAGAGAYRDEASFSGSVFETVEAEGWTDALVGYQWRSARSTLQLYGGLTVAADALWVGGYGLVQSQTRAGAKVEANLWLDLNAGRYLKFDVGVATMKPSLTGALQFGLLGDQRLSAGPEVRLFRPSDDYGFGGGLFARYAYSGGELGFSAGLLVDGRDPYLTLTYLTRY